MIRRFAVLSLSAVALAVMAAPAGAAAPELRGVVSGSPYGASQGYIAVPVLYSKMTARRAGLKSPVGLMVIKRTSRVKVNGGPSTLPVGLRVGDRFKGVAPVSALNKRIFYPRITFDKAPQVYFRSKELSLSELTNLIQAVQRNLGALSKFTLDTFGQVAVQMAGLQKQIDDLRKLLGGLAPADLSGLQSQIDSLKSQIDDILGQLATLPDFSLFAKLTDLPNLTPYALKSYVDGLVGDLQSQIDAITLPDLSGYATTAALNAAIAGLQAQIDALDIPSTTDITNIVNSILGGDLSPATVTNLLSELGLPANVGDLALESEVAGLVDTAVGALTTADLPGELLTVSELSAALPTTLIHSSELESELESLIAGGDVAGMATDTEVTNAVSGLATQASVTAANARMDVLCDAIDTLDATNVLNDTTVPGWTTACP